MDMPVLNTTLLNIREDLISSPLLHNMKKSYSRLIPEDPDADKIFTKASFNQKYIAAKGFGLSYDTRPSKETVDAFINTGITPLDAIQMNKAMQSYGLEGFTSKSGIALLSNHFYVI